MSGHWICDQCGYEDQHADYCVYRRPASDQYLGHLRKHEMEAHKQRSLTMSEFKQYRRKGLSEMRPYIAGEDVSHVSISQPDKEAGSPKDGDMIARNPKNHADQWLVAKAYFEDNLELVA